MCSTDRVQTRTPLPRSPEAAAIGRRALDDLFGPELSDLALNHARVVVSELVTNAYLHGSGSIELRLGLIDGHLRVEVVDHGTGNVPAIRPADGDETGGFGLRIVEHLSDRWGAFEGTTHVWAELPLR